MNSQIMDKKTIGLTREGELVMQKLMDLNYFNEMIDAAKFAMSFAINADVQPSQAEGAATIWNVGSFDSDGQLRQLISILFPTCETPYRAIEYLVDAGLRQINEKMNAGVLDISELVK
jgi:hypothetical protein